MNCSCLCVRCHEYFDAHPYDHTTWKVEKIGRDRFDALSLRANRIAKIDVKEISAWLKEKELALASGF